MFYDDDEATPTPHFDESDWYDQSEEFDDPQLLILGEDDPWSEAELAYADAYDEAETEPVYEWAEGMPSSRPLHPITTPAPTTSLLDRIAQKPTEFAALMLMLFIFGRGIFSLSSASTASANTPLPAATASEPVVTPEASTMPFGDPAALAFVYDNYWLTQGPHGFSYGHQAIDIAAGKGTPILSPINGRVSARYIDEYGNTTLILENQRYQITMLHGDYVVIAEQIIEIGQTVGYESNHGFTQDMQGRSCKNRDCGYHTHLNLFDKLAGQNVNPLIAFGISTE